CEPDRRVSKLPGKIESPDQSRRWRRTATGVGPGQTASGTAHVMNASPTFVTRPSGPLRGTLTVPGDKSLTHRAMILSALAEGDSTIDNYCRGADCLHTVRVFEALGVPVEIREDRLRIGGKGLEGLQEPEQILDC